MGLTKSELYKKNKLRGIIIDDLYKQLGKARKRNDGLQHALNCANKEIDRLKTLIPKPPEDII